jgi:putative aminopeptidase FrvX
VKAPDVTEPALRLALPRACNPALSAGERAALHAATARLLARPTAPYSEDLVALEAARFAAERPGIVCEPIAGGNLLLRWPGRRRGRPVLAISAHLDHPGFHYAGRRGDAHVAQFHGGVPPAAMAGAAVRFFDGGDGRTTALARVASAERDRAGRVVARLAEFRGRAARGAPGMWDLPAAELAGRRLRARVCDDLLGAAAVLAVLDRAHAERWERPLLGVLTRAEETGFVGCQALLRERALPAGSAVIGLECSPRRASARVGRGPVIRVGDAASVFDPALTHHLQECAARLAERASGFVFQRALMDGGRCESTAYNLWGLPAAGLCLALGGYHNVVDSGPARGTIGTEFVDWHDHEGLLALLLEAARSFGAPPAARMRARLDRIWAAERGLWTASARRIERRLREDAKRT